MMLWSSALQCNIRGIQTTKNRVSLHVTEVSILMISCVIPSSAILSFPLLLSVLTSHVSRPFVCITDCPYGSSVWGVDTCMRKTVPDLPYYNMTFLAARDDQHIRKYLVGVQAWSRQTWLAHLIEMYWEFHCCLVALDSDYDWVWLDNKWRHPPTEFWMWDGGHVRTTNRTGTDIYL